MRAWEQIWYLAGLAIGTAVATGRIVARRLPIHHTDRSPARAAPPVRG